MRKSRAMNAKAFFDLVVKMRESQRRWRETHGWTAQKSARYYEQLVDYEIDRVHRILAQQQLPIQGELPATTDSDNLTSKHNNNDRI